MMDIEGTYERGFDHRCNGRYPEARMELEKVLAAVPQHANARWQIGLIQGFEGDFDGSLATLKSVVNSHPDHFPARYDMAMTMMMLGEFDEACAQFKLIVEYDPGSEASRKAQQQLAYCP
jgi:protein O-GlcNAc transferase